MFKIKIYCNDVDGNHYWEDGVGTYETYDKAIITCYKNALQEAQGLMATSDGERWFEVEEDFEITETYTNKILEHETFFEVATIYYDHAPYDRENDCDIQIVTGYKIVEIKDAILVGIYDGIKQIKMNCKVNTDTKEVYDIKVPDSINNFDCFMGFYFNIDDELHPIVSKKEAKNDEYWYE